MGTEGNSSILSLRPRRVIFLIFLALSTRKEINQEQGPGVQVRFLYIEVRDTLPLVFVSLQSLSNAFRPPCDSLRKQTCVDSLQVYHLNFFQSFSLNLWLNFGFQHICLLTWFSHMVNHLVVIKGNFHYSRFNSVVLYDDFECCYREPYENRKPPVNFKCIF